jgi:hypothetical protein
LGVLVWGYKRLLSDLPESFFFSLAAAAGLRSPVQANLIADGVSMGFGEFLSGDAEKKYILSERGREAWEMKHNPTGEIEEMIELYQTKGFDLEQATTIVTAMSTNKEFFIDHMMVQEYVVPNCFFLVCSVGFVSHSRCWAKIGILPPRAPESASLRDSFSVRYRTAASATSTRTNSSPIPQPSPPPSTPSTAAEATRLLHRLRVPRLGGSIQVRF